MKLTITSVLIALTFGLFAQDTITVQTLTFDDITKRRGEYVFPAEDQQFRKILMYYTLKCDQQTTQDQFPCGEWDYLTYNFVYDHTGELDSNLITHPQFFVGTQSPDEFLFQSNALYNHYQNYEYFTVIDSVISESLWTVGSGNENLEAPLGGDATSNRSQFLWSPDELNASGVISGEINRMALHTSTGMSGQQHVTIRLANYSGDELDGFSNAATQEVYDQQTDLGTDELHFFNFTSPFEWDGTSSILVDISTERSEDEDGVSVLAEPTSLGNSYTASGTDGYVEFTEGEYIKIPVSGEDFGSEITISLWSFGSPDDLPSNTHLLEALDANGNRSLNIHHPWQNGRIFWDAGTGNGFDRIDKAADLSEYAGSWNHWAFTKNSNTGVMNIYLNGELWHTGEGLEREIGELHTFNLAKGGVSNTGYPGKVDEFQVWGKELDAATISEWMLKTPNATHPYYDDLKIYYDFNAPNVVIDQSTSELNGIPFGAVQFLNHETGALVKNQSELAHRPNVVFANGTYITHQDSILMVDSVMQQPISVVSYETSDSVLSGIDYAYYWPEGCSYWYAPDGTLTDSLCYAAENNLTNSEVGYFGPAFEVIDRWEIGRFITPYGINLSLGDDGFTWVYDVTDYAHLLRDTVDFQAGNQQELIDVKFKMITGTPPRDVLRIHKVWGDMASRSYSALDNDEVLSSTDIGLLPETQGLRLKTRLTGHGHHSNTGNYPHCCEWKDNTHYLFVNGNEFANWQIWQTHDCALNPVYPQGGTWPGAREGWCPGDLVKDNEFELTAFAGASSINLDYDITPVPSNNQGMGAGNYIVSMHLMEYAAPNHSLDAEIYNVLNPSGEQYYSRHNPICREPRVVLKNAGSEVLTSAMITYQVSGGDPLTYEWTGNLAPHSSETVTLPVTTTDFWNGDDEYQFIASVEQPNGAPDEYSDNNTYVSSYSFTPVFPFDFIVWFKTNNNPNQNSYTIKDINGNVVFERDNLVANATYRDTMELDPGCYTFEFLDTGNDGLSYWANPNQGSGYLRFKLNGGSVIENINADFGRSVFRTFKVLGPTSISDLDSTKPTVSMYPNPTSDEWSLEIGNYWGTCEIEIYSPQGARVLAQRIDVSDRVIHPFNFTDQPAGIYLVRIFNGDFEMTKKLILQ